MYIRDKREIDGGGDEKSAPPRERKTTNKKKTKKNEREREREREGGTSSSSLVEGLKSSYHFVVVFSVRVFLWERSSVFFSRLCR